MKPKELQAEKLCGEFSCETSESMAVVKLCLMTMKRCELAVEERRNVDERRNFFKRDAELLRRYSPEAPFTTGFGKLRKYIRIESLRNSRIKERGNDMRS